ncbi:MAG: hypothetical protein B6244_05485 [Candidatus Cloacimonetes bacterium 4572_55]|nr:MAG: hypothetical protein B6244_05485 [Candidatus Cloacimonetes bacterium 4572_55]
MQKRINRLRTSLTERDIDGFFTVHYPNVRYLSGFSGSHGLVYITKNRALFISDGRYKEQAKNEVKDFEIDILEEPISLAKRMWELISDNQPKKLAIESVHTRLASYLRLVEWFPEEGLTATVNLVENLRATKSPEEVQKLQEAIRINDQSFSQILKYIAPGIRENQVAARIDYLQKMNGASNPAFETIVASGENGAFPHGRPTQKKIKKGDLVTIDMGCVYEGYVSDMTRTIAIGKPDKKQREIYKIVQEAQRRSKNIARSGVKIVDVDAAARDYIKSEGYGDYFNHGLGHGIGLDIHEAPHISKRKKEKRLESGMVFTNEPGIYIAGWGGVRIEDVLIVTDEGSELLSHSPRELIEI